MKNDPRPITVFCDIDGTLVSHMTPTQSTDPSLEMLVLKGTIDKLHEWDRLGYNIILVTGRREGSRKITEAQLSKAGIIYDQLVMGIGGGKRYLINDFKPNSNMPTATAINITRNQGIGDVEFE